MSSPHKNLKEEAFEKHVVAELISLHKYKKRNAEKHYDRALALDTGLLFDFFKNTQKEKLKKLEELYGDALQERLLRRIDEQISTRGIIDVLRKGVEEGPIKFDVIFFRPTTGLNPEVEELCKGNIFSVMRQVKFSLTTEQSLDIVIFINGIPIATVELKNELTGQNVYHAINQYKTDRNPIEKLFTFKRCVAHFAVDTSNVYITTRLNEEKTHFLPFNKGFNLGKGNPPVEGKHKTHYLWEELWSRENWSDLLQFFVHSYNEVRTDRLGKEFSIPVQIFPRYQQWKTVVDIISESRSLGAGKNYLVQHSAGSGKSMTIAWLAYRLAQLHTTDNEKVYDTIIVLTDRRLLDKQLRDTVSSFQSTPGVLVMVGDDDTSAKLKDALEGGAKIITSTIQKFPVILEKIGTLPSKRFGLIVDEAHSSQSGEITRSIHDVLQDQEENNEDTEDWLLRHMKSRKQPPNLSYFAFTATPKHETLERFGEQQEDGSFRPFSLYSMKQAIEENFILDVLENYTTYRTYFKIKKQAAEDPTVPRSRALAEILQYVNFNEDTLNKKITVIMEHFETAIREMMRGESKSMIVTSSREAAVRYKLALDKYFQENGYDYKSLVAFTSSIEIDGVTYTESSLNNGISENNTAKEFKKPEYRFLIVAEKYQTGFDEPYLCAMYVDKHLNNVRAVQTLSRLNRTIRDKDEVYIIDFVNTVDDIREAFKPYYAATFLSEETDINTLNNLRQELFSLYTISDEVLDEFMGHINPKSYRIHESANAFLDNIAKSIISLSHGMDKNSDVVEENDYGKFLTVGGMYVKRYPYVSQVIGYSDVAHEKLFLLLKYLIKKLPRDPKEPLIDILKYLDVGGVRVVKKLETKIQMQAEEGDVHVDELIPGAPGEEAEDILSKIIDDINTRWGVDFGKEQQETLNTMSEELSEDGELQDVVSNNTRQNAGEHFGKVFDNKLDDQYEADKHLYEKLMNNKDLRRYVEKNMFRVVSEKVTALREQ